MVAEAEYSYAIYNLQIKQMYKILQENSIIVLQSGRILKMNIRGKTTKSCPHLKSLIDVLRFFSLAC